VESWRVEVRLLELMQALMQALVPVREKARWQRDVRTVGELVLVGKMMRRTKWRCSSVPSLSE